MNKKTVIIIVVVLVLAIAFFIMKNKGPALDSNGEIAAGASVTIQGGTFMPGNLSVKKGTTIMWTNNDTMGHTIVADTIGPNSEIINTGESFKFTFDDVGTFNYHCSLHPNMTGTIVVTE